MNYEAAHRYAEAWAKFEHNDIRDIYRDYRKEEPFFYGKLGSLNFQFSEKDHVLQVFGFVTPGMGRLLEDHSAMILQLEKFALSMPDSTAGGIFDIRTLEWNRHAPVLEPCLYLRLDFTDPAEPVEKVIKKFDALSTAAFLWNRDRMNSFQTDYWKKHPAPSSSESVKRQADMRAKISSENKNPLENASIEELYAMVPEFYMSRGVPRKSAEEMTQRQRDDFKTLSEDQRKIALKGMFRDWVFLQSYLEAHGLQKTLQDRKEPILQESVSKTQAQELALKSVGEGSSTEFVILEDQTDQKSYGWIFYVAPKKYVETKDINYLVPGVGPIVVEKSNGKVHHLPTSVPTKEAIVEFERRMK